MASGLADENGQVAMFWLALAYFIHTTGELCLSPVGLSMVTKLAVGKVVGLMMGVWFLASSVAHYVAGIIAGVASVEGGAGANAQESLAIYAGHFLCGWYYRCGDGLVFVDYCAADYPLDVWAAWRASRVCLIWVVSLFVYSIASIEQGAD